jgi:bidirectional [NiFe] hydrogenase diaphorase subunit
MSVHTFTIDGVDVAGADGETILQVARDNGIAIPTMCHLDGLSDVGACRLCVVELRGGGAPQGKLLPACTTLVAEGMEVVATSDALEAHRRDIVQMLFVERNHICSVCVANTRCELQDLAADLGVDHFDLPAVNPRLGVDASHRLFAIDHNRCILCTRCVRVCDEIEGAHTWDVMGRGLDARVVTDLGTPWGESTTCTSCGKCVQVCPTGALFEKGRAIAEGAKERRPYLPYLRRRTEEGPS